MNRLHSMLCSEYVCSEYSQSHVTRRFIKQCWFWKSKVKFYNVGWCSWCSWSWLFSEISTYKILSCTCLWVYSIHSKYSDWQLTLILHRLSSVKLIFLGIKSLRKKKCYKDLLQNCRLRNIRKPKYIDVS